MNTLNSNIYKVFISIRDKDEKNGTCICHGTTKKRIMEKTGLSRSTVNKALRLLLDKKYICEGVKLVNKKTYYITEEGMKNYLEINKTTIS